MMRAIMFAITVCVAANTASAGDEPFGVQLSEQQPEWKVRLEWRFATEHSGLVLRLLDAVLTYPVEYRLTWLNQLGNTSGVGDCGPTAVIKYRVLELLGFSGTDRRLVYGMDVRDFIPEQKRHPHVMAALRKKNEGWLVFDNATFVRQQHDLVRPQDVRGFQPLMTLK